MSIKYSLSAKWGGFASVNYISLYINMGFSGSSVGKESACSAGDPSLIPGFGRSPGRGHGNSLHLFLPGESPWREEPVGLQSMGLHRVRHVWATKCMSTHIPKSRSFWFAYSNVWMSFVFSLLNPVLWAMLVFNILRSTFKGNLVDLLLEHMYV